MNIMVDFDRVTVVGAGAMGCLFAARLAESGATVALVEADLARIDAINRDGILLDDDQGQRIVRVPASTSESAAATDLVMLFTKGMHTRPAIHSVAHLAAHGAFAVTLQNGLGNAEQIAEVFPEGKILIGATDFPADLKLPATVSSHGSGTIWLGGFTDAGTVGARAAVALFQKAGMSTVFDDGVLVSIWEKAAFNAALNTLAAITRSRVGALDSVEGRALAFAVVRETVDAAAANGLMLDRANIHGKIEHALANHKNHKPSMFQDIEAGRRTEIDSINGAIARAGRAKGVDTPVISTLASLVRMLEQRVEDAPT
jgi:2-dehydropantoate 2-reductase